MLFYVKKKIKNAGFSLYIWMYKVDLQDFIKNITISLEYYILNVFLFIK